MGLKDQLLQGIVVGLDNLDAVIRILRESSSNAIASSGLRSSELPYVFEFFIFFNLSRSGGSKAPRHDFLALSLNFCCSACVVFLFFCFLSSAARNIFWCSRFVVMCFVFAFFDQ
ncbi:unnamed protein product [Prunus brigantina]